MTLLNTCTLLQVYDMPTSLRFYRDILGFAIVSSDTGNDNADWVWLKKDEANLMLNTLYEAHERPAQPNLQRNAIHQDTIVYFQCQDVGQIYEYLIGKGMNIKKPFPTKIRLERARRS